MLVGVPISVTRPPKREANESGINVRDGLRPAFFAACISTGINSASAATLFITADNPAANADMKVIWVPRRLEASTR